MKTSSSPSSRRRFFMATAGACAALGAGFWRGFHPSRKQVVSRTSHALGSSVTLTALHGDREIASAAVDAAFGQLDRIENMMSLYRPGSQLCRLNRDGHLDEPAPYLFDVLRYATEMSARSDGAFDITVQPLWELHAEAHRANRPPTDAELLAARECVDWRRVEISPERVVLKGQGTAITLNGVAQGFATDVALRTMREYGVSDALIDTGELGSLGKSDAGEQWKIGIQHPRQEDAYAALANLQNRCLATSGDYQSTFSSDFSRNHLLDPRTGRSPGELASVSVLAPSGMEADALSTSLFILGADRGLTWLESFPETDALLILKDGRRLMTPGFPFAA